MTQPLNIQGYTFEGYWPLGTLFNNIPGVYVVFTREKWLDVGETEKLGERLNSSNHERKPEWVSNSRGLQINIAFLRISDAQQRKTIESKLRFALQPVCGDK